MSERIEIDVKWYKINKLESENEVKIRDLVMKQTH